MSNPRTHHVTTTDGVTIGATVHGQGPPLVFLQGVIGDGDLDWGPLVGHLTGRFTCHLPSLRGRGLSGDHPDPRPGSPGGRRPHLRRQHRGTNRTGGLVRRRQPGTVRGGTVRRGERRGPLRAGDDVPGSHDPVTGHAPERLGGCLVAGRSARQRCDRSVDQQVRCGQPWMAPSIQPPRPLGASRVTGASRHHVPDDQQRRVVSHDNVTRHDCTPPRVRVDVPVGMLDAGCLTAGAGRRAGSRPDDPAPLWGPAA